MSMATEIDQLSAIETDQVSVGGSAGGLGRGLCCGVGPRIDRIGQEIMHPQREIGPAWYAAIGADLLRTFL